MRHNKPKKHVTIFWGKNLNKKSLYSTVNWLTVLYKERMNEMEPVKISKIKAHKIINKREPLGIFYFLENDVYIGIDNSTGDSFVEEFKDKETCLAWLTDKSISYFTEEDFGKTLDELKFYEDTKNTVHEVIITEHFVKSVIVHAEDKEEAISIVEKMYDNGKIYFEKSDLSDVSFK